jgi:hypothetical protein
VSTVETAPEAPPPSPAAVAERTREQIFRYARYVHVGTGAENCPMALWLDTPKDARDGDMPKCPSPDEHFHAWVRLPNPFQMKDIAEKARAAKARRVRSLKDPTSDPHVILENELDALMSEDMRAFVVSELIDNNFREDYDEALREVLEMEDPTFVPEDEGDKIPKLYANIEQDQEEYARQVKLPEDARDEDFEELRKTVEAFSEAVQVEMDKITKPKRESLMQRDMAELIDLIRKERIEMSGNDAYLHTFNSWQWFVCTYIPATARRTSASSRTSRSSGSTRRPR